MRDTRENLIKMTIKSKLLHSKKIQFGDVLLNYHWGYECFDDIIESISQLNADNHFIVTDTVVYDIYGHGFIKKLSSCGPVHVLQSPPGEAYKSLDVLTSYLRECFDHGVSRKSVIIGFGGGIPGNLAGLLSSLLFRGIRLVHIPTTSVAMFDSVLSLKQAINSPLSKNSIGSFYLPEGIYTDLSLLSTLPENHRRSGLCETIKNAICIVPQEIAKLKLNLKNAMDGDAAALNYILKSSIEAKQAVMQNDKYEKKDAVILEYGHTIGHAIEVLLSKNPSFQITHGEAVGLGMIVAAHVSKELGFLEQSALDTHLELLGQINSPCYIPANLEIASIIEALGFDNKRGYLDPTPDVTPMVLLKELGQPLYTNEYPLHPVLNTVIAKNLKQILKVFRRVA